MNALDIGNNHRYQAHTDEDEQITRYTLDGVTLGALTPCLMDDVFDLQLIDPNTAEVLDQVQVLPPDPDRLELWHRCNIATLHELQHWRTKP